MGGEEGFEPPSRSPKDNNLFQFGSQNLEKYIQRTNVEARHNVLATTLIPHNLVGDVGIEPTLPLGKKITLPLRLTEIL